MSPIFYIILGAALLLLAEEFWNNHCWHKKERDEQAYRDAIHKENGLAVIEECRKPIYTTLKEDEAE